MPNWMKRGLLLNEDPPADGGGTDDAAGGGNDDHKWAGKYDSPDALEAGYQQQRELLGLPKISGDLVGKPGRFASFEALEAAYLDEAKIRTRPKPKAEDKPKGKAKGDEGNDDDLNLDPPPKGEETDDETGANKLMGKTVVAAGDDDATVRVRLSQ